MRINHPVTASEFPFPPGETLVSTTDLKGRILYCNPAFIAVSGYTKEELLGQPHNLIRHPDMPEEAFRDMWETIAAGNPWSAAVKNRRKDGSYYWVMANVTPLMKGDAPVGYMSVRTEPTREQVAASEQLYRTMREEKASGQLVHRLQSGRLVTDTLPSRIGRVLSVGAAGRVGLLAAAVAGTGVVIAGTLTAGFSVALVVQMLAVAALTGLGTLFAAQNLLVAPLTDLLTTANRMAAGDLTQRIEVHGKDLRAGLARALSQLNVNLRSIVRDARTEVDHMRDATREIAAGNQNLSSRTESQAASLQETAASMEQITATVRNNAASAAQAAELATRASEVTEQGSIAMSEVTSTMQVINQSSHRISEIIGVIDSIAFQTNILALNAAVEAARAGEQGRGFAVVAAEVRALAQRTTGAAREVKQLINESAKTVENGTRITDEAQKTMEGALHTVRSVSQVIAEISAGAQEQLSGISQVNEAVSQMDSITQQNAAMVEQIAASAVQLQGQAATVSESVGVFCIDNRHAAGVPDAVAMRRAAKTGASGHGELVAY